MPWAAPEGLSHHPGLPLSHEEELQARGCLSKPGGSTGKHQYPSKDSQKPSSIPRVRVSLGAAQQVGLCTSSLLGCSCPARLCMVDRQGSPGEGPHMSPPWGSAGRGPPDPKEGGKHPSQLSHSEQFGSRSLFFGAKPRGFCFPHQYFLSSHPPAPRAVKR